MVDDSVPNKQLLKKSSSPTHPPLTKDHWVQWHLPPTPKQSQAVEGQVREELNLCRQNHKVRSRELTIVSEIK